VLPDFLARIYLPVFEFENFELANEILLTLNIFCNFLKIKKRATFTSISAQHVNSKYLCY